MRGRSHLVAVIVVVCLLNLEGKQNIPSFHVYSLNCEMKPKLSQEGVPSVGESLSLSLSQRDKCYIVMFLEEDSVCIMMKTIALLFLTTDNSSRYEMVGVS